MRPSELSSYMFAAVIMRLQNTYNCDKAQIRIVSIARFQQKGNK